MESAVRRIGEQPSLTCPKCNHPTSLQHVPDLPTAAQMGHKAPGAEPHGAGHVIDEAPTYARNPNTLQCVGCGNYWHETELDPAGASFAHLRSEYAKKAG